MSFRSLQNLSFPSNTTNTNHHYHHTTPSPTPLHFDLFNYKVMLEWPFGFFLQHVLGVGVILQTSAEGYDSGHSRSWIRRRFQPDADAKRGELPMRVLDDVLRARRGLPSRFVEDGEL